MPSGFPWEKRIGLLVWLVDFTGIGTLALKRGMNKERNPLVATGFTKHDQSNIGLANRTKGQKDVPK